MSDNEENDEKPFVIERAKSGRAACKKCKQKLESAVLRMAKKVTNPWGSGTLNHWYHIDCLLESFKTQRATTKTIESLDDISGWESIGDLDKESILEKLEKLPKFNKSIGNAPGKQTNELNRSTAATDKTGLLEKHYKKDSNDNLFREFHKICNKLSDESSYLGKTAILHKFFLKGCNGKQFEGNLFMWIKMLLPSADKRIYNLQSKQLIKLFARLFNQDQTEMLTDLEQGDVSETIKTYFEKSTAIKPLDKSKLTLDDVDEFLKELAEMTKEDEQTIHFRKFCKLCTADDLKMTIRFIKHDIKINSGPKHVLAALSDDAYAAYQSSRDLYGVVCKFAGKIGEKKLGSPVKKEKGSSSSSSSIQVMCPISPMLAEACKSVEKAITKCPAGMYSEIKYDGERVQLHKKGNEFKFFSRNLKPVQEHKIKRCQEFIPKAFPNAYDLILDSEVIVVDTITGELLPFGTLGKHKKTEFETAEVCLFVFDCIYYNGEDLTKKTMKERRQILEDNISPIKNHVQLSEYHLIKNVKELSFMVAKVLQMGLEGLVLKNVNGIYEPGKRHWLKVKKDYLFDGKMADTADLVVLGAWFGTGKKGGMLSIFLMGCFDSYGRVWKTVTKVHTGLDDKTMDKMQKILTPLMNRADIDNPPDWLQCKRALIPDMLAKDPKKMPVWEITGAEFSKSEAHTANGISIRFPRITKQRNDKSYAEATNLEELKALYQASKDCTNLQMLTDGLDDADIDIKTKLQGVDKPSTSANVTQKMSNEKSVKRDRSEDDIKRDEKRNKIENKSEKDKSTQHIKIDESPKKIINKDSIKSSSSSSSKNENEPIKLKEKKRKIEDEDGDDDGGGGSVEKSIEKKAKIPEIFSMGKKLNAERIKNKNIQSVDNVQAQKTDYDDTNKSTGRIAGTIAKNSDINIFEGVLLYVPSDVRCNVKEEIRYFVLWGGTELNDAKKCTHVLHKNASAALDGIEWKVFREKYQPTCRHVQFQWLIDSVLAKDKAAVDRYPVTLLN